MQVLAGALLSARCVRRSFLSALQTLGTLQRYGKRAQLFFWAGRQREVTWVDTFERKFKDALTRVSTQHLDCDLFTLSDERAHIQEARAQR